MPHVTIPKTMQALRVTAWGQMPELQDVAVPLPGPGEVLVKMAASPINPSDLGQFMSEGYAHRDLPFTPGNEGSGQVVASGGGPMGSYLLGKQVACGVSSGNDGAWAEYMRTKATNVLPLGDGVNLEQGSMTFVNPLTAYALLDIAQKNGHRAVMLSAAASQLGRMINRLAARKHIAVVNVVRRPAQVRALTAMGAPYVLDSSTDDFDAALQAASAETGASLLLECIGGATTERLMRALPTNAEVLLVGAISREAPQLDWLGMLQREIRVAGFFLPKWLAKRNLVQTLLAANTVMSLMTDTLYSEVQARFKLAEVEQAIQTYVNDMSAGKVLFTP